MYRIFAILWFVIRCGAAALVWQGAVQKFGRRGLVHGLGLLAGIVLAWTIPDGFVTLLRNIYGLSVREMLGRIRFYLVLSTAGQLLALLPAWLFYRYFARRKKPQRKWLALALLFPTLSLLMLLVVFWMNIGRNDLSESTFWFCCVLETLNCAVAVLISGMEKSTLRNQEMALLHKQLQIQTESILSLEKSYRAQRQATHEFRSQLQTIHGLLENGGADTAKDYVRQLLDDRSVRIFSVHSGHPIVDAVVQQKHQTAREKGIEMTFQVSDLGGLKLNTNQIVVLLSNLLDNAIEGCLRCTGERRIECSMILEESLFLAVRNTAPPVVITGKTIPTTKEPKEEHGFGLLTIRHILEENGGEYHLAYRDGWFEFAAELPGGKETEE